MTLCKQISVCNGHKKPDKCLKRPVFFSVLHFPLRVKALKQKPNSSSEAESALSDSDSFMSYGTKPFYVLRNEECWNKVMKYKYLLGIFNCLWW